MKKLLIFLGMMAMGAANADTETINWYVDGSVYNTTSCQSGGNVTLPAQPSKTGYTFVGWEIALYDFSTLDPSVAGNGYTQSAANRTWATTFDYGTVSGVSLCSVTGGTFAVAGTPDESTTGEGTRYCWCKATGYTPSGSNVVYENTSSSAWVSSGGRGSASDCASLCASLCGSAVQYNADFRRSVFGVTQ